MIQRSRIGEHLSRIVPLTGHDVEEILQEQAGTQRRFGEIALAWGLCQPEHVWNAWCRQLAQGVERVDLNQIGIDAQAVALLPAEIAREFTVIPVRIAGEVLIVASATQSPDRLAADLLARLRRKTMFVHADESQIRALIEQYYGIENMKHET